MAANKIAKIQAFSGLISAPFTGFKPNGEVNADIIQKYVDFLVKNSVKGVFVNGTTGEGLSLTVDERKLIAEKWVEHGKNKLELIIIQVGANCLREAQELARHAEKIGVTALASLPPLFYKPKSDDDLIAYFKGISDAAPNLPLMLYHIPSYSNVEINVSQLLPKARAAIPNFCGAKFTSTDVLDLMRCHNLPGEPFKVLTGFDEVLLPCITCGGTAAIGGTFNMMALLSQRVLDAYHRGDIEEARRANREIMNATERICRHGMPIACFKAAMNILTPLDFGTSRVPLVPLTPEGLANLKADLKAMKTKDWFRV